MAGNVSPTADCGSISKHKSKIASGAPGPEDLGQPQEDGKKVRASDSEGQVEKE